jgi:SAM-dependent methyltransferase
MKESLKFYNNFDKKLINDYVLGNRRIESAIINLCSFIPKSSKNILDVGCGLGWSSYEFSKQLNNSQVLGIDLSNILVKTASKLFSNNNLSFEVFDVTKDLPKMKYDAIVMIDVYEHIPKDDRQKFHNSLKRLLNEQGRLILACPSKYHQLWLKKNKPEGLQPVDEDVDNEVILELAKDINGELIYFEYQNIWRSFDYLYAVIEINPIYNSNYTIDSIDRLTLENKTSRAERVKARLKIEIPIENTTSNKTLLKLLQNKIRKILKRLLQTCVK